MKETRKCIICNDDFRTKSTSKRKTCSSECSKKNLQNYRQSPEYRELQKKSQQSPEGKKTAKQASKKWYQNSKNKEKKKQCNAKHYEVRKLEIK